MCCAMLRYFENRFMPNELVKQRSGKLDIRLVFELNDEMLVGSHNITLLLSSNPLKSDTYSHSAVKMRDAYL